MLPNRTIFGRAPFYGRTILRERNSKVNFKAMQFFRGKSIQIINQLEKFVNVIKKKFNLRNFHKCTYGVSV